jgi:gliding motility-associated-like protein
VRVSNGSDFCTDTVTVMVSQSSTSIINQSICLGQSFLGRTISGTYIDTLNGANSRGCDSIRTLNLTVNLETFSTINQTICQGKSFLGRTISGTYIDTLKNSNSKGCDSIRTLNLTVNPSTFSTINQTICQGDSFLGKKSTGIYVDTLNGANSRGCDSIRTLNLFVNSSIAPTALDSQIFCMSAQIKDLIITGNLIKWYQDSLKKIILNDNAQLSDNVTYYATQSINNCESAIKKVKAYINLGNITSDKPSYCEGDTISLTFQSLFNKLLWFNGATTKTIKIIAQQSMSYAVDYSYRNKSCSTSINIVSYPIPPKPKATSPQTYSNDNTLDDLIVTGNSLNWYEDSFLQKNIPSSTSLQNEKVYYVTQRANNCESEATAIKATLELKVLFDSIYVNNSMSPNNDQIMDAFTIENIHLAKNNKIQIANRWGEIVFEKENYQNDWYGEYLTNGYKNNTLPDGVYYYVFSFTIYGQKNEKTGYIYIKK